MQVTTDCIAQYFMPGSASIQAIPRRLGVFLRAGEPFPFNSNVGSRHFGLAEVSEQKNQTYREINTLFKKYPIRLRREKSIILGGKLPPKIKSFCSNRLRRGLSCLVCLKPRGGTWRGGTWVWPYDIIVLPDLDRLWRLSWFTCLAWRCLTSSV